MYVYHALQVHKHKPDKMSTILRCFSQSAQSAWAHDNSISVCNVVLLSSQTCRTVIGDLLPTMTNEKRLFFSSFHYLVASLWQVCNLGSGNETSAGTGTWLAFMLRYLNVLKCKSKCWVCRGSKQRWDVNSYIYLVMSFHVFFNSSTIIFEITQILLEYNYSLLQLLNLYDFTSTGYNKLCVTKSGCTKSIPSLL